MNRLAFQIAQKAYVKLLRVFPKSFREEYGESMTQLFRDQCHDAHLARGWVGMALLLPKILTDTLLSCLREHFLYWSMASLFHWLTPKRVFLLSVCLSLSYVFLVANRVQPEFSSFTKIYFQIPADWDVSNSAAVADVYLSVAVMDDVISRLGLREKFARDLNRKQPLSSLAAFRQLRKEISFVESKNKKFVEIHVQDKDRESAARIANAVAEALHRGLINRKSPLQFLVVDSATPALYPITPKRALNFVSGILVSMLATFLVLVIVRVLRPKAPLELCSNNPP